MYLWAATDALKTCEGKESARKEKKEDRERYHIQADTSIHTSYERWKLACPSCMANSKRFFIVSRELNGGILQKLTHVMTLGSV